MCPRCYGKNVVKVIGTNNKLFCFTCKLVNN